MVNNYGWYRGQYRDEWDDDENYRSGRNRRGNESDFRGYLSGSDAGEWGERDRGTGVRSGDYGRGEDHGRSQDFGRNSSGNRPYEYGQRRGQGWGGDYSSGSDDSEANYGNRGQSNRGQGRSGDYGASGGWRGGQESGSRGGSDYGYRGNNYEWQGSGQGRRFDDEHNYGGGSQTGRGYGDYGYGGTYGGGSSHSSSQQGRGYYGYGDRQRNEGDQGRIGSYDREERAGGSSHSGKGPKGWQRSDERVREDINETLARHSDIDPSEVEIKVENGEVTMTGTVSDRWMKRHMEDIVYSVFGVQQVHNQVRVSRESNSGNGNRTENTSNTEAQREGSASSRGTSTSSSKPSSNG